MALKKPVTPAPIDQPASITLQSVSLEDLRARPGENPNVVDDAQFAALVHSIRGNGFLQPIAVRPIEQRGGPAYEVIDGHHRWRAAKEVGLLSVPALVVEASSSEAAVYMLSLNRLRGELNLASVAGILKELSDGGFPDMTLSGFNGGEIQSLLDTVVVDGDGIDGIGEDAGASVEPEQIDNPKRYAVRLVFDRPEDRDAVKATALQFGLTVEAGILELCRAQESVS